jgi:hypothetical protein
MTRVGRSGPLVARLTLEEQVALTMGDGMRSTTPLASAGVPSLKMTDGPCGARGEWSPDDAARVDLALAAPACDRKISTWPR